MPELRMLQLQHVASGEVLDIVTRANVELDAKDARIAELEARVRGLTESLAATVRYIEEEAREGDGIREDFCEEYATAKIRLSLPSAEGGES